MLDRLRKNRVIAQFLIIAIGFFSLQPVASAAMIGTQDIVQQDRAVMERAQLLQALDRQDVRSKLESYGVNPDMAKQRVASMTDAEVAQMNAQIEQMPAGAGVLEVALIVFLVLLFTDIAGYTDVFPFVKN